MLMDRHGLPRYRQSDWLANALGLSYSQAHRRLNGASPWSLEDLAQLAALFDETLQDLVAELGSDNSVNAALRIGDATIECRLWLGNKIGERPPGRMVAVRSSAGWVATGDDQVEGERFEITRLQAAPAAIQRRAVAVLDDDPDVTSSIVGSLELLGFRVHGFCKAKDLAAELVTSTFDGFVLDWIVDDRTIVELIRSLREISGTAPIVVLTGQVASGAIDESHIADAMRRYDLLFCEKPVRASILAAMLNRAFSSGRDAP
jgi:CheY-like chemotaxis protein